MTGASTCTALLLTSGCAAREASLLAAPATGCAVIWGPPTRPPRTPKWLETISPQNMIWPRVSGSKLRWQGGVVAVGVTGTSCCRHTVSAKDPIASAQQQQQQHEQQHHHHYHHQQHRCDCWQHHPSDCACFPAPADDRWFNYIRRRHLSNDACDVMYLTQTNLEERRHTANHTRVTVTHSHS